MFVNQYGAEFVLPGITMCKALKIGIYLLLATILHIGVIASQDKPKIQRFQFPLKLEVNEKTSITCMLRRGQPPYTFKWYKDGKEITSGKIVTIQSSKLLSNLVIDPVTREAAGNYTCVVSNAAGSDSFSSEMTVTSSPSWILEPVDLEGIIGNQVNIQCSASGSPTPRIIWSKKGSSPLWNESNNYRNGIIEFKPLKEDDDGEYTCIADNGIGETLEKTIVVVVHDLPVVQPFQFPDQVEIGKAASVMCAVVSGKQPFEFQWYKDGKIVNGESINTQRKTSSLLIDPVEKSSGGNYTCIVSNAAGRGSYSAVLTIKAPPTWLNEPNNIEIVEGERASMNCVAVGYPSPVITWKKISVPNQDDYQHSYAEKHQNGSLIFHPVFKSNEGQYLCIADNGAGPALEKSITVKVNGTQIENLYFFMWEITGPLEHV